MKNISFALTTQQVRERTKTVTRRLGWKNVKRGELLQACVKCQGLKKGQHPEKLCTIRVVKVSREALEVLTDSLDYGFSETTKEGFPDGNRHWPSEFVAMFCDHNGCTPKTIVTRIEFEYV